MRLGLALSLLALVLSTACTRAASETGRLGADEQRLLPGIVQQQEWRVRATIEAVEAAQDDVRAVRLRQQMLVQYGRPDLAGALEAQAKEKEHTVVSRRQRLADEEAALAAYRDYAARGGVRVGPAPHGAPAGRKDKGHQRLPWDPPGS